MISTRASGTSVIRVIDASFLKRLPRHVGTVDKIEGDQIVLTKDDPSSGGVHHQIPITAADNVSQDKVTLKAAAANAKATWTSVPKPGNDPAK